VVFPVAAGDGLVAWAQIVLLAPPGCRSIPHGATTLLAAVEVATGRVGAGLHSAVRESGAQPSDHPALHPTSGSRLNLLEIFFSIITRQAISRGSFAGVKDLIAAAIGRFVDGWHDRCRPFGWARTAEALLDHCRPGQRTSFTRHQCVVP
jgi:hypothetical protein